MTKLKKIREEFKDLEGSIKFKGSGSDLIKELKAKDNPKAKIYTYQDCIKFWLDGRTQLFDAMKKYPPRKR